LKQTQVHSTNTHCLHNTDW